MLSSTVLLYVNIFFIIYSSLLLLTNSFPFLSSGTYLLPVPNIHRRGEFLEYSFLAQSNCLGTVFTQMESLRSKNAGYEPSVVGYTSRCLIRHVPGSLVGAGFWTGIGVLQGSRVPLLPTFTRNLFFLYTYLALQCPMEAIHGKRSLLHCTLSGGIIGYIGCQRKMLGMPQNIYESIVLHSKGRIRGSAAVSVFYAGAATFLGAFTRGV